MHNWAGFYQNLGESIEMARKVSKSKKKGTTENSFADYISSATKRLVELARSNKAADRFSALNALVFILVLGFIIAHLWIYPQSLWSLSGFVVLLFSLIASLLIGVYGYVGFLNVLANRKSDDIEPLKISTIVLLVAYPLAFAGLVFSIRELVYIAFGLIPIQALVLIVCSMFGLIPSAGKGQTRGTFDGTTGVLSLVLTVVDIIVTLASIIISVTLR